MAEALEALQGGVVLERLAFTIARSGAIFSVIYDTYRDSAGGS